MKTFNISFTDAEIDKAVVNLIDTRVQKYGQPVEQVIKDFLIFGIANSIVGEYNQQNQTTLLSQQRKVAA